MRAIAAVIGLAIGLAAVALSRLLVPMPELSGHAHVIDGDTLILSGHRVRLVGLDAPERDQLCTSRTGENYPCGAEARDWLIGRLRGQSVICQGQGHDDYGRVLATCSVNESDIGAEIVLSGWAIAESTYRSAETSAREARRGIWQGAFTSPAQWRKAAEREDGVWAWIRNLFR